MPSLALIFAMVPLLTVAYTMAGGITAVIWTDVLQVFVLLGGALLALVIIALSVDGGPGGIVAAAQAAGSEAEKIEELAPVHSTMDAEDADPEAGSAGS